MRINVFDLVGTNAVTPDAGAAVFDRIHGPLRAGDKVTLDFSKVEVFASPFFNAAVGQLLEDLPQSALSDQLKFENLSDFGSRVVNRVIANAKDYYASSKERRQAIESIVAMAVSV